MWMGKEERAWYGLDWIETETRRGMCVFVVCCVLFLFWLFYLRVCFIFSFCFIFIEYYTCFRLIAHTTHTYLYTQNSIISISVASKSPEPKVERTSNTEKSNAKQKEIGRCHLVRSLSIRVWCLASSIISISANGFVVAYVYISLVHSISHLGASFYSF